MLVIGINGLNSEKHVDMENISLSFYPNAKYFHIHNPTTIPGVVRNAVTTKVKKSKGKIALSMGMMALGGPMTVAAGGILLLGSIAAANSDPLLSKAREVVRNNALTFDEEQKCFLFVDKNGNIHKAKEIVLLGHSHGGMVVYEYLKRLKNASLAKNISAITFGCPIAMNSIELDSIAVRTIQIICKEDMISSSQFFKHIEKNGSNNCKYLVCSFAHSSFEDDIRCHSVMGYMHSWERMTPLLQNQAFCKSKLPILLLRFFVYSIGKPFNLFFELFSEEFSATVENYLSCLDSTGDCNIMVDYNQKYLNCHPMLLKSTFVQNEKLKTAQIIPVGSIYAYPNSSNFLIAVGSVTPNGTEIVIGKLVDNLVVFEEICRLLSIGSIKCSIIRFAQQETNFLQESNGKWTPEDEQIVEEKIRQSKEDLREDVEDTCASTNNPNIIKTGGID